MDHGSPFNSGNPLSIVHPDSPARQVANEEEDLPKWIGWMTLVIVGPIVSVGALAIFI